MNLESQVANLSQSKRLKELGLNESLIPIKGFEGYYCISNQGIIYSIGRKTTSGGQIKTRIQSNG